MRTCRYCKKQFTRVEGLKKRIKSGCTAHGGSMTGSGTTTTETDQVFFFGRSCQGPGLLWLSPWPSLRLSRLMCAFYSSRILREWSARSGKTHLPSQSMCAAFVSTASSVGSGVRHSSLMHPEAWTCKTTAETRCRSLLLHASDPCKYCGKSAKQPRRHLMSAMTEEDAQVLTARQQMMEVWGDRSWEKVRGGQLQTTS